MYVSKLEIKDFRAFQQKTTIELSKHITCISGHNGIGKSTILAILSNCGELKGNDGRHLNGSLFRGDFSDIVKGDKKYDTSGEKAILYFQDIPRSSENDVYVEELAFRATFQKNRYRLIPKKIPNVKENVKKLKWPTFYLGLSRLYPVGESQQTKRKELSEYIINSLIHKHAEILSLEYDENASIESIGLKEVSKLKTGVETSSYSSTANSAGQDNIGQILLTIMSFEQLKNENPEEFNGGIMLIDEIDATLHPSAQRKLFDYLLQKSKDIGIQIIFTTHSLSLLEYIASTRKQNNTSEVRVSYLIKRGEEIREKVNPTKSYFQNDLMDTYTGIPSKLKEVPILTEDETARWFLENLLMCTETELNIKLLDVNISWTHLINLILSDFEMFKNYIIVLDPDLKQTNNIATLRKLLEGYPIKIDEKLSNILILPTHDQEYPNIEKTLWKYIESIPETHNFFLDPVIEDHNWHKRLVMQDGVYSQKYSNFKEELRYKNWFQDNKYFLERLLRYWYNDYKETVDLFVNKLKGSYGYINKQINK